MVDCFLQENKHSRVFPLCGLKIEEKEEQMREESFGMYIS